MRTFTVGIDIGQRVDHSAVCVCEVLQNKTIVRLLTKYPLGIPYNLLVETVIQMVKSIREQGEILYFVVDATGIGAAPAAMFQEALPDIRVDNFIFTNKSKRELIGKVKVLHSFGRLKFATKKGDEVYNRTLAELMQEMKQIQAKIIREGLENPEVEVFKTGTHDDLFTALALAVKDIQIPTQTTDVQFVEDKSWVKTPLTEGPQEPTIFLV